MKVNAYDHQFEPCPSHNPAWLYTTGHYSTTFLGGKLSILGGRFTLPPPPPLDETLHGYQGCIGFVLPKGILTTA